MSLSFEHYHHSGVVNIQLKDRDRRITCYMEVCRPFFRNTPRQTWLFFSIPLGP